MSCAPPPKEFADPRDVGALAEPLRSRVATLIADAPDDGLVLVSGKRTPYQQWLLRHDRCPGRECDPGCKGVPTTALPGRSNHQKGLAADLGGRALDWANRVKARYGLVTPVRGEPWHFEARGTPSVPIKPYGKPSAPPKRILREGDEGQDVLLYQALLNQVHARWPQVPEIIADGDYGPRTKSAVFAFEQMHNRFLTTFNPKAARLQQDGIATLATQEAIVWWAEQARK